ncbi:MAG: hypothetical protein ACJAZW_000434 [Maritalea sp.]|jgi:hypothetical protein
MRTIKIHLDPKPVTLTLSRVGIFGKFALRSSVLLHFGPLLYAHQFEMILPKSTKTIECAHARSTIVGSEVVADEGDIL